MSTGNEDEKKEAKLLFENNEKPCCAFTRQNPETDKNPRD